MNSLQVALNTCMRLSEAGKLQRLNHTICESHKLRSTQIEIHTNARKVRHKVINPILIDVLLAGVCALQASSVFNALPWSPGDRVLGIYQVGILSLQFV